MICNSHYLNQQIGNTSQGVNLTNSKSKSFGAETFDGIHKGCFESLIADGAERDQQHPRTRDDKDPGGKRGLEGIVLEPLAHAIVR